MNGSNLLFPKIVIDSLLVSSGVIALTAYAIWRGWTWWNASTPGIRTFDYGKSFLQRKLMAEKMKAIQDIRKERLDDPTLEVNRLLTIGSINEQDKASVEEWAKHISLDGWCRFESQAIQKEREEKVPRIVAVCLQGIALQNVLKKTHYIFWHAQSTEWMCFTYLLDAIEKRHHSNVSHYKFLRPTPQSKEKGTTIYDYCRNIRTHDHKPQARRDLISTNSDLGDTSCAESALWHLYKNTNQLHRDLSIDVHLIMNRYPRVLKSEARTFVEKINQYVIKKMRPGEIGNLIAFCVPKDDCEDVQYRSEKYGVPCGMDDSKSGFCRMTETNPCKVVEEDGLAYPHQYRIFTPALNPYKHSVYMFSSIIKEVRHDLKYMIHKGLDKFEDIAKNRTWCQYWMVKGREFCKRGSSKVASCT